jgi:hypothetical protein
MASAGMQRGFLLQRDNNKSKAPEVSKKTSSTLPKKSGLKSGFLLGDKKAKAKAKASTKGAKIPSARSNKSSSEGFAKGFLISVDQKQDVAFNQKTSETDVPKVIVSQALLDFDDPRTKPSSSSSSPKKHSFLISDDTDTASPVESTQQRPPLIRVLSAEETPTNRKTSPLISFVSSEDDSTKSTPTASSSNEHNHGNDHEGGFFNSNNKAKPIETLLVENKAKEEEEVLFTQVTSRLRNRDDDSFLGPLDHRLDHPLGSTSVVTKQRLEDRTTISSSAFEYDTMKLFPDDTKQEGSSFFQFQQELENWSWKKNQEEEDGIDVLSISKDWTPDETSWAWQWIVLSGKKRKHQPLLVQSLLHWHPVSVLTVLRAESQEERVMALQVVQWIQEYLESNLVSEHETEPRLLSIEPCWSITVLNTLLKITEQPRRTVLAHESWKAALWIVIRAVCEMIGSMHPVDNNNDNNNGSSLTTTLKLMDQVDRLLQVQLAWKRDKKTSAKTQAMVVILEDWIRINKICRNNSSTIIWRQQVTGLQTAPDCSNWGGLQHTLCSKSATTATTTTSIDTLDQVLAFCWQEKTAGEEDPYEFRKRILLRGAVAKVATIKKIPREGQQRLVELSLRLLPRCRVPETIELVQSLL